MARFRLSRPAQDDLASILAVSAASWGMEARDRYAAIVTSAMRQVAAKPDGPLNRLRPELLPGIRSFHLRHARQIGPHKKVKRPVHVLYYREIRSGLIEIVRVLHERMEPNQRVSKSIVDGG